MLPWQFFRSYDDTYYSGQCYDVCQRSRYVTLLGGIDRKTLRRDYRRPLRTNSTRAPGPIDHRLQFVKPGYSPPAPAC